ncbi:MAG: hypothetical protein LC659_07105, partial [Myxococcales bacterium]|nr:hypothetical protein [Myxococcales bacterium]
MRKLGLLVLLVAGCGNHSITQQSGAAACITASACGIIAGGVSICSQFVVSVNDPAVATSFHISPSEVLCLASAGSDCTAARRCLSGGSMPATCSGNAKSCNGNTWQQCTIAAGSAGNEGIQTFDCSAYGEMCVTNNGNTDCGYGTCSGISASCVSPDGAPGGNLLQTCNGGILQRTDCSRIDASCNPSGVPHCRGNGAVCSKGPLGDTTLRCDGSVLVTCADGQEARTDCARDNLGCFAGVGNNAFGCAAGTACDPNNFGATCSGNAKSCNGNTWQQCTIAAGSAGNEG